MRNVVNQMKLFSLVRTVLRCFGSIKDDYPSEMGAHLFKEPAGVGCEYGVRSSIKEPCWTFLICFNDLAIPSLKSSRVKDGMLLQGQHIDSSCSRDMFMPCQPEICFFPSAGIHILESPYIIQTPFHQRKTHQVI